MEENNKTLKEKVKEIIFSYYQFDVNTDDWVIYSQNRKNLTEDLLQLFKEEKDRILTEF